MLVPTLDKLSDTSNATEKAWDDKPHKGASQVRADVRIVDSVSDSWTLLALESLYI